MPLFTLFKTPNTHYVFDPVINSFHEISQNDYTLLTQVLRKEIPVSELSKSEHILSLQQQGFLCHDTFTDKINHPYLEIAQPLLERKLRHIVLQVTQQCNLRCKYCIYSEEANDLQRTHSAKQMTFETAKKAIDTLRSRSVDSDDLSIGLYGGEPLLAFNLIKRIVEYTKTALAGRKVSFHTTTNGTLLTPEIIDFLYENKFNVMVSLDGAKHINDKNRVFPDGTGSFDTVISKLRLIKQMHPDMSRNIAISVVVDPSNNFDEIFPPEAFEESLFSPTQLNVSLISNQYECQTKNVDYSSFSSQYTYHEFLALMSDFGRISRDHLSPIAAKNTAVVLTSTRKKFDRITSRKPFDAPGGPCIPGKGRLLVNVDGVMLPCERVSELSPIMHIGTLDTGLDYKKIHALMNVAQTTATECNRCWAFHLCQQCCSRCDASDHLSGKQRLSNCSSERKQAYFTCQLYLLKLEAAKYYYKSLL